MKYESLSWKPRNQYTPSESYKKVRFPVSTGRANTSYSWRFSRPLDLFANSDFRQRVVFLGIPNRCKIGRFIEIPKGKKGHL